MRQLLRACIFVSLVLCVSPALLAQTENSSQVIPCADLDSSFSKQWSTEVLLYAFVATFLVPLIYPPLVFSMDRLKRRRKWWLTRPYLRWLQIAAGMVLFGYLILVILPWQATLPTGWTSLSGFLFSGVPKEYFACKEAFNTDGLFWGLYQVASSLTAAQFWPLSIAYVLACAGWSVVYWLVFFVWLGTKGLTSIRAR